SQSGDGDRDRGVGRSRVGRGGHGDRHSGAGDRKGGVRSSAGATAFRLSARAGQATTLCSGSQKRSVIAVPIGIGSSFIIVQRDQYLIDPISVHVHHFTSERTCLYFITGLGDPFQLVQYETRNRGIGIIVLVDQFLVQLLV